MQKLEGKTAFITGGAEGIGYQIGRALAGRGMKVMLADIDEKMLDQAVNALRTEGGDVAGVVCDVALREELERAAEKTIDAFGKVHILVNNAGVSVIGSQKYIPEKNWRWIIDVNLMGVVYGAQVFVPLIQSHKEGGHIINVASMAGMKGLAYAGPYCATKAAVVALSEGWRDELEPAGIGVSVLCPAFVKSRIYDSMRNRQQKYGGPIYFEDMLKEKPHLINQKENVVNGIDTEIVGKRVLEAIANNEAYIFTHPNYRQVVDERYKAVSKGFDEAEASPALEAVDHSAGIVI